MASRKRSYKIGADLDDAATLRAAELGYPSVAAYIKSLIRHDCSTRSRHAVTVPWAYEPPEVQDQIDARIHRRVIAKQGMTSAELKAVDWRDL